MINMLRVLCALRSKLSVFNHSNFLFYVTHFFARSVANCVKKYMPKDVVT